MWLAPPAERLQHSAAVARLDERFRSLRAITRRRGDAAQRLLRAHIEQSKTEVRHSTLDMLYRARWQA